MKYNTQLKAEQQTAYFDLYHLSRSWDRLFVGDIVCLARVKYLKSGKPIFSKSPFNFRIDSFNQDGSLFLYDFKNLCSLASVHCVEVFKKN